MSHLIEPLFDCLMTFLPRVFECVLVIRVQKGSLISMQDMRYQHLFSQIISLDFCLVAELAFYMSGKILGIMYLVIFVFSGPPHFILAVFQEIFKKLFVLMVAVRKPS